MEKITYEKALKLFDGGDDCAGRLNAAGMDAIAHFAAELYEDADYDIDAIVSKIELHSANLLNPCGVHSIEFSRQNGGNTIYQRFTLDPAHFDWFVRSAG